MSDARLLTDVSLALRQWRRSWSRSEALQWVESELATMGSDERSRYEQIYEAAHAAAATDSSNALDAKRTRHFLAQCRLSPERMESVMKTVNPNNNSSIDSTTFVKARPARPALQARAAACALRRLSCDAGGRLELCELGGGRLWDSKSDGSGYEWECQCHGSVQAMVCGGGLHQW